MKTAAIMLTLIVVALLPRAVESTCQVCYQDPGGEYGCINQNPGYTSCQGGSQCTKGDECAVAGCFLRGTMVETADGPKAIELIDVGDEILSFGDDGQILSFELVARTVRVIRTSYYLINNRIRVTAPHPFRVGGRWVTAGNLKVGDIVTGAGSEKLQIESVVVVSRGVRAYNIEVGGSHTFLADGMLVHNKGPTPEG